MHEMGERKRAQELRVDEVSVQKKRENHETIQRLTSQLQQMQEQVNSMNDSGDFQAVESNNSGRSSHVSSQRMMIPSSRAFLSRDERLPHDTWNTSGPQENVFANQFSTVDSSRNHYQRSHHSMTPGDTGSVPVHIETITVVARDEDLNWGTIAMPNFAGRPSSISSLFPLGIPQNSMVAQQRQQISELHLDIFPAAQSFFCWKDTFTNQVTTCSDFPSEAMLWIKEEEMVDSLEELKTSRSSAGKNFQNFEMLDARIASALTKITQNSLFKKKVSLEEQKAQKEERFLSGRQLAFMIYDYFRVTGAHDTVLDCAGLLVYSTQNN